MATLSMRRPTEQAPPRMAPLAKLPVFLDLAGRRAVVAGGSAPAAWKAELLAAAGARVEVLSAEPGGELWRLAQAGKRVVRLKAGDPIVFGRAGEVLAELEAAGVPVDVPGITAALALAATLGVSLTHRELTHSVRFVTGHGRAGSLPAELDWQGLADPETTLIVYMGGGTAASLAERLIAAGLPAAMPACAIAGISQPGERRWSGPLNALGRGVATLGSPQPVLIGIGAVFRRPQGGAPRITGAANEPALAPSD